MHSLYLLLIKLKEETWKYFLDFYFDWNIHLFQIFVVYLSLFSHNISKKKKIKMKEEFTDLLIHFLIKFDNLYIVFNYVKVLFDYWLTIEWHELGIIKVISFLHDQYYKCQFMNAWAFYLQYVFSHKIDNIINPSTSKTFLKQRSSFYFAFT